MLKNIYFITYWFYALSTKKRSSLAYSCLHFQMQMPKAFVSFFSLVFKLLICTPLASPAKLAFIEEIEI